MRTTLFALVLLAAGCGAALSAPCTEAALVAHAATCNARIRLECKPKADGSKDLECPAFVECTKQSLEEETRCNAQ